MDPTPSSPSDQGRPGEASPADVAAREAAWEQLRGRLELQEDFWLGFVFGASPRVVGELVERSANYLRPAARRVLSLDVREPADLSGAVPWLLRQAEPVPGLIWVTDRTGRSDNDWRQQWRAMLVRLNERRELLRLSLPTGLVVTGARWLLPLARDMAPDLWSYRSTVYLAGPASPADIAGRPRAHSFLETRVTGDEIKGFKSAQPPSIPPVEDEPLWPAE